MVHDTNFKRVCRYPLPGHVWFPNYKTVSKLLEKTRFKKTKFLCYHTEDEALVRKYMDYSNGYIGRVPLEDDSTQPIYSIVIDCCK